MAYDAKARKQYKLHARMAIHERFWPTMGAVLLTQIPLLIMSMILNIGMDGIETSTDITVEAAVKLIECVLLYGVIYFFVGSPIVFGAKHYYVGRARGADVSISTIFGVFGSAQKYITSLKLSLCIAIRSLGWMVLTCGVLVLAELPLMLITNDTLFVLGLALYVILAIAVVCVLTVKIRRYHGAYICMIDKPDASVWEATRACARIFKEHNWELFVFDLSFLLWELATVLTLGVVGIYVTAYTEIAFTRYFDGLCDRGKETMPEPPSV